MEQAWRRASQSPDVASQQGLDYGGGESLHGARAVSAFQRSPAWTFDAFGAFKPVRHLWATVGLPIDIAVLSESARSRVSKDSRPFLWLAQANKGQSHIRNILPILMWCRAAMRALNEFFAADPRQSRP